MSESAFSKLMRTELTPEKKEKILQAMTYSRLANKMAGINKRDEATVMQLNNLSLMENIILHEVDLGIMRGKHYQEIYRDCKKRLEAVKDLAYLEAV